MTLFAFRGVKSRSWTFYDHDNVLLRHPHTPSWPTVCSYRCMSSFSDGPAHLATGRRGEDIAVLYLRLRFYRILVRNFSCKMGEIDIVARKKGTIIFVEVRTRRDPSLTDPLKTVDDRKITRITNAARYYLLTKGMGEPPCRFDVIGITLKHGRKPQIRHIENAF